MTMRTTPLTAPRARRRARGFSLMELMVVISIMGIMGGLAFPAFHIWVANAQVRTTADLLQMGLRSAKSEAERRNRQVQFLFTNDTPGLNSNAVAGGTNWSMQTVAQFAETTPEFISGGKITEYSSGVTVTTTPSVASICFDSIGRVTAVTGLTCTATALTIDVNRVGSNRPLRITVAVGGQVRMCDPNRPARSATSYEGC